MEHRFSAGAPSGFQQEGLTTMPCGARARLTAYVAYQTLTFAERDVLLAALADAGFTRVDIAPTGTEAANPVPVLDAGRRFVGSAALVVRRTDLTAGLGDLGFAMRDGGYVPLMPDDARSKQLIRTLRIAYGRAKADQLAEQARQRYQATVKRHVAADGTVTIRVRF
jgi:hypothetical protein